MSRRPEFRDVVDPGGLTPGDEARVRRVHDLLVAAGPPPELPPRLHVPTRRRRGIPIAFPPRRPGALLVLAATLAAAAFGGGYTAGHHRHAGAVSAWGTQIVLRARGAAVASLALGSPDAAGNQPLRLRVRGLPALAPGGYYELVLTRDGKPGAVCGAFVVAGETTTLTMTVPYRLERPGGWAIVRDVPGRGESGPVLST